MKSTCRTGHNPGRHPVRALAALFAAASTASAAVWTGGQAGVLDGPSNWDGDITTSTMVFTNDCVLTLSADATVRQPLTDSNGTDVPNGPVKQNSTGHAIVFDLAGHALSASYQSGGNQLWSCRETSATFTGGGIFSVLSGTATNTIVVGNNNHYGQTLAVSGAGTRFVGSFLSYVAIPGKPGGAFRLLDGAEAVGPTFQFAGLNSTNEVSGGSRLRYHAPADSSSYGFFLGGRNGNPATGGMGDVMRISGVGTVVEPAPSKTTNGLFKVGYGGNNGGNRLVVEKGAALVLPRRTAIGHGTANKNGEYHSDGNELAVIGHGTTLRNDRSDRDNPTAVGERGSFNRLLVDDGAFAKLNGLSCGGEVKAALNNDDYGKISTYVSAWNTVAVDRGSTLDAGGVSVGNQHVDSKQLVAQYGAQCYSNRVEILGGSSLYATNAQSTVGSCSPYFGNVLSIAGAGTEAKLGAGQHAVIVGQAGSCSNRLEVLDGATAVIVGSLSVATGAANNEWGYAADGATAKRGIGNVVRVEGAGASITGVNPSGTLYLGSQTNGNANVVFVGDSATLTWPGNLAISGFDNVVAVSNGTIDIAGPLLSVWNNASEDAAGRTRFVFSGAAPRLVASSTSQSKFKNGASLRFEVPAAGWAEAPLQLPGTVSDVLFGDDTRLEVDAEAFWRAGGGEAPLVVAGSGLSISGALLDSWNAALKPRNASVSLAGDGRALVLKVKSNRATIISLR